MDRLGPTRSSATCSCSKGTRLPRSAYTSTPDNVVTENHQQSDRQKRNALERGKEGSTFAVSFGYDESGPFETGLFYGIDIAGEREHIHGESDEWIVSGVKDDDYVTLPVWVHDIKYIHGCSRNREHETDSRSTRVRVGWWGGQVTPFLPGNDLTTFMSHGLYRRLRNTDLVGTEAIEAEVEPVDEDLEPPRLFVPLFPGRWPAARKVFSPPTPNACPNCGHGPLVCPECEQLEFPICPKCNEECLAIGDETPTSDRDKRIYFKPTPERGHIIDAARWDGSDFSCGVLTKRAVDFLASIHAGPFKAQPLRAFFGSCSPEEIDRITSEVTRPVKEK